jgi:hypothetical protein
MKKLIALAACAALSACSIQDECASASNPTECRNWSDAGGNVNDYLLYGMVGYMIGSNSSGQSYIYRDPGYRGSYHPSMANKYGSQSQEIKRLKVKIERQKVELRRQQQQQRQNAAKSSSYKPSSSSYKPSTYRPSAPAYRPSSGGGFKSK